MIPESRLIREIPIPEGVQVEAGAEFTVKGPGGELKRDLSNPTIELKVEGGNVIIKPKKFTKRQKCIINTTSAHIRNMIKGVQEPFVYELKICSSHFPMTVNVEGNNVVIKNLFGEKIPRKAKILPNVKVEINSDLITVTSPNKESAGQTAVNIEKSTTITNRDRRVFQDGIWITNKGGKKVGA
jgi:large subunit ribosomal protein L6